MFKKTLQVTKIRAKRKKAKPTFSEACCAAQGQLQQPVAEHHRAEVDVAQWQIKGSSPSQSTTLQKSTRSELCTEVENSQNRKRQKTASSSSSSMPFTASTRQLLCGSSAPFTAAPHTEFSVTS